MPKNPRPRHRWTLDDVLTDLGAVVARRVRLTPTPGTATEADALAVAANENLHLELFDGYLAEKGAGLREIHLIMNVLAAITLFVRDRKLGIVVPQSGMVRLRPGLIRCPDASFFRRGRPDARWQDGEFAPIPDLAVEVVGAGNTRREADCKVAEYREAGVRLVWIIEPRRREARAYPLSGPTRMLSEDDALDGGEVLPGLVIPLRELFEHDPGEGSEM